MKSFVQTKVVGSYEVERLSQEGWHVVSHFAEQYIDTQTDHGKQCPGPMNGGSCTHGYNYSHTYEETTRHVLTHRQFLMGRAEESLVAELQSQIASCEWKIREAQDEADKLKKQLEEAEAKMENIEPELQKRVGELETQNANIKRVRNEVTNELRQAQLDLQARDERLERLRKYFDDDDYFESLASGEPPPEPTDPENDAEKRFSLLELDWKEGNGDETTECTRDE